MDLSGVEDLPEGLLHGDDVAHLKVSVGDQEATKLIVLLHVNGVDHMWHSGVQRVRETQMRRWILLFSS